MACASALYRTGQWSMKETAELLGLKSHTVVVEAMQKIPVPQEPIGKSLADLTLELPSPEEIIAGVCAEHGEDPAVLQRMGNGGRLSNLPRVVKLRHACAVALYKTGRWGQAEVARLIGMRSGSSLGPYLTGISSPTQRYRHKSGGFSTPKLNTDRANAILSQVAEKFAINPKNVLGRGREFAVVNARSEFCYRCRTELGGTYQAIGKFLGIDHSSVMLLVGRHMLRPNGVGYGMKATRTRCIQAAKLAVVPVRPVEATAPATDGSQAQAARDRERLLESHREAMRSRFDAPGVQSHGDKLLTLVELADFYGVSRETAREWERQAIDHLRLGLLNDPYIQEWIRENT